MKRHVPLSIRAADSKYNNFGPRALTIVKLTHTYLHAPLNSHRLYTMSHLVCSRRQFFLWIKIVFFIVFFRKSSSSILSIYQTEILKKWNGQFKLSTLIVTTISIFKRGETPCIKDCAKKSYSVPEHTRIL